MIDLDRSLVGSSEEVSEIVTADLEEGSPYASYIVKLLCGNEPHEGTAVVKDRIFNVLFLEVVVSKLLGELPFLIINLDYTHIKGPLLIIAAGFLIAVRKGAQCALVFIERENL